MAYIMVFLLSPKDITDYTIVDTEYWRETKNRLLIKTAYEYNNKEDIKLFPKNLGERKGYDFRYQDNVYKILNADILLSRAYSKNGSSPIWIDIINSRTGESFHKQNICMKGAGWNIYSDTITEFKIANPPNPFTKLYANRLDMSRGDEQQIMIYWFMFKKFGGKDAVTMIRITTPVVGNDTDKAFGSLKDFVEGQLFDAMYQKSGVDIVTNAENIRRQYGNKGLFGIIIMIIIPIGMTIFGIRQKD